MRYLTMVETYVWTPHHKKHKFFKAEILKTPSGRFVMYKCKKCGDIKLESLDQKPHTQRPS